MKKMLTNLVVIITRPKQQAQDIALQITEHGGKAIIFPTVEIVPFKDVDIKKAIHPVESFDLLIFVSQNAVAQVAPWLPLNRSFKVAAIGPSTAQALLNFNISCDLMPTKEYNSEHLMSLPFFNQIAQKKVLILAGQGGRTWLEQALRVQGADVKKVSTYKRQCPSVPFETKLALTQQKGVILVTSYEGLINLQQLMQSIQQEKWLKCQDLLVISTRIKHEAIQLGFSPRHLLQAENATNQAILDSLIKWYAYS